MAKAKNDYLLKKNTYFAKRYQIVEVNADLLKSAEKIKISLIGDSYVVAEVTSLKVGHGGQAFDGMEE
ncbi:MAG: hypothetical protein WD795_18180 [Woeseia sp.]